MQKIRFIDLFDRILSLIDREQGGAEFYRSVGLDFEAVFTINDLQKWMANKS
ncbi:hypothetical protein [Microcoleus anatoxicus]|uniref:Uncharacterized protein n=1 Tax=Microcoleus anatoxicus PTRS2 TaxID=2705321 RepID=A0ABU8YZD2_9CYAN